MQVENYPLKLALRIFNCTTIFLSHKLSFKRFSDINSYPVRGLQLTNPFPKKHWSQVTHNMLNANMDIFY